jgi:hypothetical protein
MTNNEQIISRQKDGDLAPSGKAGSPNQPSLITTGADAQTCRRTPQRRSINYKSNNQFKADDNLIFLKNNGLWVDKIWLQSLAKLVGSDRSSSAGFRVQYDQSGIIGGACSVQNVSAIG